MKCLMCENKMTKEFTRSNICTKPRYTLSVYICEKCGDEMLVKKFLDGGDLSIKSGYITKEDREDNLLRMSKAI